MSLENRMKVAKEDFDGTRAIYDDVMAENVSIHDFIYPHVFGPEQYIGQFSDNSKSELELMCSLMNLPSGSRVMDLGCGRGNVAAHFARCFGWNIVGVDISSKPIEDARSRHSHKKDIKIDFVNSNIYDFEAEKSLDGIYGTGSFCHFDIASLFNRCSELLHENNGVLAFMERTRIGVISEADWIRLTTEWCCPYVYSKNEYVDILHRAGFKVQHCLDLTETFTEWQNKSVTIREHLKDEIVKRSSLEYFERSIEFARYENDVTQSGGLGYVCIVAQKGV